MFSGRTTFIFIALPCVLLCGCQAYLDSGPPGPGQAPGGGGGPNTSCGPTEREPIHRLTRSQLQNSVSDVFGVTSLDVNMLPQSAAAAGFELAGPMSRLEVSTWLGLAETVGAAAALSASYAGCSGQACLNTLLSEHAPRLYRRPLEAAETQRITAFYEAAVTRSPATALSETIAALLMTPQFLFHDSFVASDGQSGQIRDFELLSRLSYFLWNGPPDQALLSQVAQLSTPEGLRAVAASMMADPRFERGVHEFFGQLLHLSVLDLIDRGSDPAFTPQHAQDLRRSLEAFIRYAVIEEDSLDLLLGSNRVYLNARLGSLYGHPEVTSDNFVPVEFPAAERVGLLTQPALMALFARRDQTDPIHRGLFVLRQMLCVEFGPPPAVVGLPAPPTPGVTTRERFEMHRANPACASCHDRIDPIGFAFENFDLLGRYRTEDSGRPVDASATVLAPEDLIGAVANASELATRIRTSETASTCMATQWLRYAVRREPLESDQCHADTSADAFRASSGSFRQLLLSIVEGELFQLAGASS